MFFLAYSFTFMYLSSGNIPMCLTTVVSCLVVNLVGQVSVI